MRVKVRIESTTEKVESAALVNSGFEAEAALIILPLKLAKALGYTIERLEPEGYIGPGDVAVIVYPLHEKLKISVLTEDRVEGPVLTEASINLAERELILSDAVSSALKISIDDPKGGLWKFRGEDKSRESVKKEEGL